MVRGFSNLLVGLFLISTASAQPPSNSPVVQGTTEFLPTAHQEKIPERYRLAKNHFDWELKKLKDYPGIQVEILELRFPSPVKTLQEANNTVVGEYYRPTGTQKPFPCVIVLDILAGDGRIARMIAQHLAQNGIGGLYVYLPHYGPRRAPGSSVRLLSPDVGQTMEGFRQAVLDLRRATAWMEGQPEIDRQRLGITGTSLGSFAAALTAEMEPKLSRLAVLLGGGGFVDAYWEHPRVQTLRLLFELAGGKKESLAQVIAPVDPLTRADLLRDRKVLVIGARHDEIVPPTMSEAFWKATGEQKIVWLNAGHLTAAFYLPAGLKHLVDHFGAP